MSLDFIAALTHSNLWFNVILITIFDRYTKMTHFLPCTKDISSEETSKLVVREVFCHQGLPDNIINDRGP